MRERFASGGAIPDAGERALIEKLRENCEPIRVASDLARSFGEVVRTHDMCRLTSWVGQTVQTVICKEMKGLPEGFQARCVNATVPKTDTFNLGKAVRSAAIAGREEGRQNT
jgi:hypothetical protein